MRPHILTNRLHLSIPPEGQNLHSFKGISPIGLPALDQAYYVLNNYCYIPPFKRSVAGILDSERFTSYMFWWEYWVGSDDQFKEHTTSDGYINTEEFTGKLVHSEPVGLVTFNEMPRGKGSNNCGLNCRLFARTPVLEDDTVGILLYEALLACINARKLWFNGAYDLTMSLSEDETALGRTLGDVFAEQSGFDTSHTQKEERGGIDSFQRMSHHYIFPQRPRQALISDDN